MERPSDLATLAAPRTKRRAWAVEPPRIPDPTTPPGAILEMGPKTFSRARPAATLAGLGTRVTSLLFF